MRLLAKATAAATFFSTAAALSGHPSRPPDPNIAAAGYFTHSSPREGPLPSCPVDSSPAININALYKNLTLFGSTRSADDGDNINTLARLASPPAPSLASPTATYSAASVPTTTTTTTTVAPRAVYTNINIASYIASYLASSAGPTPPPRSLAAPSPTPAPAPAPTPGPGPGPAPGPTSTLGSPPVHGNTRPAPGSSSVPVARPVAGPCTCPAVAAPALTEEQKHFWVYASFGIKIDKIRSELYACRAPPARLPREIHLAWRATELRIRAMRAAMPAPPPENVSSEIQVLNADVTTAYTGSAPAIEDSVRAGVTAIDIAFFGFSVFWIGPLAIGCVFGVVKLIVRFIVGETASLLVYILLPLATRVPKSALDANGKGDGSDNDDDDNDGNGNSDQIDNDNQNHGDDQGKSGITGTDNVDASELSEEDQHHGEPELTQEPSSPDMEQEQVEPQPSQSVASPAQDSSPLEEVLRTSANQVCLNESSDGCATTASRASTSSSTPNATERALMAPAPLVCALENDNLVLAVATSVPLPVSPVLAPASDFMECSIPLPDSPALGPALLVSPVVDLVPLVPSPGFFECTMPLPSSPVIVEQEEVVSQLPLSAALPTQDCSPLEEVSRTSTIQACLNESCDGCAAMAASASTSSAISSAIEGALTAPAHLACAMEDDDLVLATATSIPLPASSLSPDFIECLIPLPESPALGPALNVPTAVDSVPLPPLAPLADSFECTVPLPDSPTVGLVADSALDSATGLAPLAPAPSYAECGTQAVPRLQCDLPRPHFKRLFKRVPRDVRHICLSYVPNSFLEDVEGWFGSDLMEMGSFARRFKGMHWVDIIMLTDQQLYDLGILSAGPRGRLLTAFHILREARSIEHPPEQPALVKPATNTVPPPIDYAALAMPPTATAALEVASDVVATASAAGSNSAVAPAVLDGPSPSHAPAAVLEVSAAPADAPAVIAGASALVSPPTLEPQEAVPGGSQVLAEVDVLAAVPAKRKSRRSKRTGGLQIAPEPALVAAPDDATSAALASPPLSVSDSTTSAAVGATTVSSPAHTLASASDVVTPVPSTTPIAIAAAVPAGPTAARPSSAPGSSAQHSTQRAAPSSASNTGEALRSVTASERSVVVGKSQRPPRTGHWTLQLASTLAAQR